MFCPKCGKENVDDAVACTGCGRSLGELPANSYVTQNQEAQEIAKSTLTWGWVLATIGAFVMPFLALGGILIGIIALTRQKTSQGIGMIVASIFCGIAALSFWEEFWPAFEQALK